MLDIKKLLTKLLGRVGSEYFTLTPYAGFDSYVGYGFYDKSANTIRLYMFGMDSANIPLSAALFTVPEGYRPTRNTAGIAVLSTDSVNGVSYHITVGTDGTIKQNFTNYLRRVLAVCEYQLGGGTP